MNSVLILSAIVVFIVFIALWEDDHDHVEWMAVPIRAYYDDYIKAYSR